jgi:8-oxo-dGTP pyrophosphatase MutT (NUDIX family)
MTFHLVTEPGGNILDTITLDGGSPVYDTGDAKNVIESLNRRTGSIAATIAAIRDGGWSNGYFTIKPAGRTATKGASDIVAAGLAVVAADTGRVLMLQRHMTEDDPAGGYWELPGGRLDPGETPLAAARREWHEETGLDVPAGKVTGSWEGKNGIYHGFVITVPHETVLPILDGRKPGANPDDPDGDETEALAWWDPAQWKDNPAIRPEMLDSRKRAIRAIRDGNTITKSVTVEKCLTCGCDLPAESHGDHRHITMQDINDAADAAGITPAQAWHNLRAATPAAVTGGPPEIVKVDEGEAGDFKARHLIRWFNEGADGKIPWGAPGDLTACHVEASKHMPSNEAWGFCNNRHHDVLGTWNSPDKTVTVDVVKGFDPAEIRDGHGRWSLTGDAIHAATVKVGNQHVDVTAHANGDRTLTFPNGQSVRMTKPELTGRSRSLRSHTFNAADDKHSEMHTVSRITARTGPDGKLVGDQQDLIGLRRIGEAPGNEDDDTYDRTPLSLHVGGDSEPAMTLTQGEAFRLADAAGEMNADRVGTGTHQVDVIRDGTDVVLRPVAGGEWRLNRRSARKVYETFNALVDDDGRDERPSGEVASAVAQTNMGPVTISVIGDDWGETTLTTPGQTPVTIASGLQPHVDFLEAFRYAARME